MVQVCRYRKYVPHQSHQRSGLRSENVSAAKTASVIRTDSRLIVYTKLLGKSLEDDERREGSPYRVPHKGSQEEVYTPSFRPRAMPPRGFSRKSEDSAVVGRIDGTRIIDGVGNQWAVGH